VNSETVASAIKAPEKFGFPKVPRIFPYGFVQLKKSPKIITHRQ
jgi:hypothetical protein